MSVYTPLRMSSRYSPVRRGFTALKAAFSPGLCLGLLFGLLTVLSLPACAPKDGQGGPPYTLAALTGPSAMGLAPLRDSIAARPGDLRVIIHANPLYIRKMLLEGTADFAALPLSTAALLYNMGAPYRLMAVPVTGSLYLAGREESVRSWEDLRGKRVLVPARGMTPDLLFRALLEARGLKPEEEVALDYRFPSPVEVAQALLAGQGTLAVLPEPHLSLAARKDPTLCPLLNLGAAWREFKGEPLMQTALVGRADLLEARPQLAAQVEAAYRQSTARAVAQADSTVALWVAQGLVPDRETGLQALPRAGLHYVPLPRALAPVQAYLAFLWAVQPQSIGGKMPDEAFYWKK